MFSFNNLSFMPRSIWVVGCGGTGSRLIQPLGQMVAARGVPLRTNIFLIDGDEVEAKNCNRQLFIDENIGQNKASVLADRYQGLYNHVNMVSLNNYLSIGEVFSGFLDDALEGAWDHNLERTAGITPAGPFEPGLYNISDHVDGSLNDQKMKRFQESSMSTYLMEVTRMVCKAVMAEDGYSTMSERLKLEAYVKGMMRFFEGHFGIYLGVPLLMHGLRTMGQNRSPESGMSRAVIADMLKVKSSMVREEFRNPDKIVSLMPAESRACYMHSSSDIGNGMINTRNFETGIGASSWFTRSLTDCDEADLVYNTLSPSVEDTGSARNARTMASQGMLDLAGYAGSAHSAGSLMRRDGAQTQGHVYIRDLYHSFIEPDIIILGVDSPEARREVLTVAQMLTTKKAKGGDTKNVIVVDPGNEDTFGQVSVSCLGRKPTIPTTGKVTRTAVFNKRKVKGAPSEMVEVPLAYQMLGVTMGVDGSSPPINEDLSKILELMPNRGFFDEPLSFAPWSPVAMLTRKAGEVQLSCADLDQTLAINNMMAASVTATVQNILLNQALKMETMRFSLVSNTSSEPTSVPWLKAKFGEGTLEESSVVYMAAVPAQSVTLEEGVTDPLDGQSAVLCAYRHSGELFLDVYKAGSMECIFTTSESPLFELYVDVEFGKKVTELNRAELIQAKLTFSSLINEKPFSQDLRPGYSAEYLSIPTLSHHRLVCGGVGMLSGIDRNKFNASLHTPFGRLINQIGKKEEVAAAGEVADEVLFAGGVMCNDDNIFDITTSPTIGKPNKANLDVTSQASRTGVLMGVILKHIGDYSSVFGCRTNFNTRKMASVEEKILSSVSIVQSMMVASRMLAFVKNKGGIHDSYDMNQLRGVVEHIKTEMDRSVAANLLYIAQFLPSDPWVHQHHEGNIDHVRRAASSALNDVFTHWQGNTDTEVFNQGGNAYQESANSLADAAFALTMPDDMRNRVICGRPWEPVNAADRGVDIKVIQEARLDTMPDWVVQHSDSHQPYISGSHELILKNLFKEWGIDLFAAPVAEEEVDDPRVIAS